MQPFSAEPFDPANASLRAGTTDRDEVARQLGDAYAAGKLDDVEHRERLEAAMEVKTLGEIPPLLADLGRPTPAPLPMTAPATQGEIEAALQQERSRRNRAVWGSIGGSLALFAFFNAIWLMPVLSGADVPYWPIWPMFGVGMGAAIAATDVIKKSKQREGEIRRGYTDPLELRPDTDD